VTRGVLLAAARELSGVSVHALPILTEAYLSVDDDEPGELHVQYYRKIYHIWKREEEVMRGQRIKRG